MTTQRIVALPDGSFVALDAIQSLTSRPLSRPFVCARRGECRAMVAIETRRQVIRVAMLTPDEAMALRDRLGQMANLSHADVLAERERAAEAVRRSLATLAPRPEAAEAAA